MTMYELGPGTPEPLFSLGILILATLPVAASDAIIRGQNQNWLPTSEMIMSARWLLLSYFLLLLVVVSGKQCQII